MRRHLVSVLVLVVLGAAVWAGIANMRARRAEKPEMTGRGQQLALVPEGGAATPLPQNAEAETGAPPSPLLGKAAPDFTLTDTAGRKVSLGSYKGRPVLVNFWATWCGPCKLEMPWLAALRTKYAGQGFEVLGVSADELGTGAKAAGEKAEIAATAEKNHANYPVLVGGGAISDSYGGVDALPESFFVDRTGKIVAVLIGAGSKEQAEANVKKAIGSGV